MLSMPNAQMPYAQYVQFGIRPSAFGMIVTYPRRSI